MQKIYIRDSAGNYWWYLVLGQHVMTLAVTLPHPQVMFIYHYADECTSLV
jgi:hypothetical protein